MGRGEQIHKILVVDDDEHVLVALEGLLENQGYETTTAWSGREALKLLGSSVFDLVLLDDHLPDVTTEGILRQLQTAPLRTPVILMQTARLTLESAARFVGLEIPAFVNKWKPDEIVEAVREHLSRTSTLACCAC